MRRWVLALALTMAAGEARAKDEACTDGVDCLCDTVAAMETAHSTDIIYCEDFELADLNDGDSNGTAGPDGWAEVYPGQTGGCFLDDGISLNEIEGTCDTCCVDIVQEAACGVSGQSDCVFQGTSSKGARYEPGEERGIHGEKTFTNTTHLGVTMAVMFSNNFENQDTPKKTNEFGTANNCVLGCSSGTIVSQVDGNPYHGSVFSAGGNTITGSVVGGIGQINTDSSAFRYAANVGSGSSYDFDDDFGLGSWHCIRFEMSGIGTNSGVIKHWIDDTLWVHVENVQLSEMVDASGIDRFAWNHYMNTGYQGADVAYRYEDNFVVTDGEPVPCSAIGFGESEPEPSITISSSVASDSTPAFNTAIDVTVTFSESDTTGTITAAVDCENDGGYEDGSNTGTSPITVSGVCPYTSSGAQTIGVRVQDTGPTASDTDTVAVTVEAAPPGEWSGDPTNTNGAGFYPPNKGGGGGRWMPGRF